MTPQWYPENALFSTQELRVLKDRALHEDVVIPASADGAARQATGGELRATARAASPQLDQRVPVEDLTVERQNRGGAGLDVEHVVELTPVFVGLVERPPSRGERKPAISAGQVSEVRHATSMAPLCVTRALPWAN